MMADNVSLRIPFSGSQEDLLYPPGKRVSTASVNPGYRMDDDNVSIGGLSASRRWRSETIVRVVVPDRSQSENEKKKKKIFTPSMVEYVKVLSILYAIVMTIIGIIFPIAEALSFTWLKNGYNAAFMSYQLLVGTIFLIYLHVYLAFEKRHLRRKAAAAAAASEAASAVAAVAAATARSETDTDAGFESRRSSCDELSGTDDESPGSPKAGHNNNNDLSPYGKKHLPTPTSLSKPKNTPLRRFKQRIGDDLPGSGCSTPTTSGSPTIARKLHLQPPSLPDPRRPSVDFDALTNFGPEDDGPSVVWMDVSKFGSIFNHEGSSLFLKVGALMFSLGNVIYYSLEIENSMNPKETCHEYYTYGWTYILLLIFVLFQTFFLFKGPNVHEKKHLQILWFGMLHLMSTNICLWVRIVVREIMQEYEFVIIPKEQLPLPYYTGTGNATEPTPLTNVTTLSQAETDDCQNVFLHAASRYLFPFVLEYSLIAVGTISCIVCSISEPTDSDGHLAKGLKNLIKVCSFQKAAPPPTEDDAHSTTGSILGHGANSMLNKSHGGMFTGALLFAGIIVAIVLFYFYDGSLSLTIYLVTDIVVHSCLLCGCFLALYLIRPLAYVAKPMSPDDALLIVAMCGSMMFELAVLVASSVSMSSGVDVPDEEQLRVASAVISGIQSIVQTLLILCAVRRYPSSQEHISEMPGRGTFTFLIVGNVSVWVMRTALAKSVDMSTQSQFYGEVPWLLLINLNLPLLLFFRFHCSVCFADVWHIAYTPLHEKIRKTMKRKSPGTPTTFSPTEDSASESGSPQIPQICIISPGRRQSMCVPENMLDTISVASFHSTTM